MGSWWGLESVELSSAQIPYVTEFVLLGKYILLSTRVKSPVVRLRMFLSNSGSPSCLGARHTFRDCLFRTWQSFQFWEPQSHSEVEEAHAQHLLFLVYPSGFSWSARKPSLILRPRSFRWGLWSQDHILCFLFPSRWFLLLSGQYSCRSKDHGQGLQKWSFHFYFLY